MPLKTGYSHETFEHNYAQMKREGYPHAQALAIAYSEARKSYFAKHPDGALPQWLTPRSGERMTKTARDRSIKKYCAPCERKENPDYYDRPMASKGLTSYRYKGHYGYVMIGAKDERDALSEAARSVKDHDVTIDRLEVWDGTKYIPAAVYRKNPVPPSKRVQLRDASDLYERFTGHDADEVVSVDKPVLPDVMLVVGDIDGILYSTVRDGVEEKYIHKFKKNCRPLFTVSHDGKQLFMLGGSYDFTERGIVDKT